VRLTSFTDYALRVLIHVASAPEGRSTIAEVARAFDISEHHLVKVVHLLGREGFLANSRGRGGGLRLALPPADIRVDRVVRATERPDLPAECFDRARDACVLSGSCRLASVLAEAARAFHEVLSRYTLADLVREKASLTILLHRRVAA